MDTRPLMDDRLSITNPPRPATVDEVQFEVIFFDPIMGEGEWHIYKLPDEIREYYYYPDFETVAMKILSSSRFFQDPFKRGHVLDYLHNTKVLTVNLVTGEMFNPFLEELNRRTREQARRGYRAPEGAPSGIYES